MANVPFYTEDRRYMTVIFTTAMLHSMDPHMSMDMGMDLDMDMGMDMAMVMGMDMDTDTDTEELGMESDS